MWCRKALVLCSTLFYQHASAYFSENFRASGLIGSHFGILGVNASFDYVVVGGGTAGLTLATRLAEDPKVTVAVIEAGGFYELDNGNRSEIPADAGFYLGSAPLSKNPLIDWQQYTEPQMGLDGRSIFYTRGKTLGGSSARNFMAYQRGTKGSYQKWADEVGDDSYSWDSILPYFKKSVIFIPPNNDLRIANATPMIDFHAFSHTGGPLRVGFPNFASASASWFELALQELGLRRRSGFESGGLLGYSILPSTIDGITQTRSTSETSFLRKALLESNNLIVYQRSLAKRILFDSHKKATGVEVETAGVKYVLSANKEVILSAGAFRSPQLLMVSGIGPKKDLAELNIPLIAHRPGVGQNLQDHLLWGVVQQMNLVTHSILANDPAFAAAQLNAYNTNRTGMLTNSGSDLLGWEKLPKSARSRLSQYTQRSLEEYPDDWPEVEFLFEDEYVGSKRDFLADAPIDGKMYASTSTAIITPFSRGTVTLKSNDTTDNPIVDMAYLTDPRDQEIAVQAFRRARDVFATDAMKQIIIGDEAFPGTNVSSDAEILENIKQTALEVYHASCTCKMGRKWDPMAVVDSEAKVIGVQGLRVVDASAFPFLPPGHPQATVYMLAEKIAHSIWRENNHHLRWFDRFQHLLGIHDEL